MESTQLGETESAGHPTFSIVIEGFTVTAETADGLVRCLESLDEQDLSPRAANEVLLMSVGQIGRAELHRICGPYPWVEIVELPPGTRYFGIKMSGAQRVTGEVVVFCDADNVYHPGSLRSMILPFADDPDLNVLTGQTSVECDDLRSTVFGLTFFFPPFTPDRGLEPAGTYFANNSAFRLDFLLANPIDTTLPLLRGNDYVHSFWLRQAGHTICRQTGSRATHAAPETAREFILRYLARGSDRLEIWRRTRGKTLPDRQGGRTIGSVLSAVRIGRENAGDFLSRLIGVARQSPRALLFYPLAIPLGVGLLGTVLLGLAVSAVRPGMLVNRYLETFHSPRLRTQAAGDSVEAARLPMVDR